MFMFLLPLFMLVLIAGIVIISVMRSDNFYQTEVPSTIFNWTESVRICLEATDRRQKYCLSGSTILIKIYLKQAFLKSYLIENNKTFALYWWQGLVCQWTISNMSGSTCHQKYWIFYRSGKLDYQISINDLKHNNHLWNIYMWEWNLILNQKNYTFYIIIETKNQVIQ